MKIDLYNNDCKIVLQELVDKGIIVDTIIADIPYNIKRQIVPLIIYSLSPER